MTEGDKQKPSVMDSVAAVGPYLGHGLTLAMATGLFFFVGWTIDGRLGTTPILSILGALVGAAGGFYYLIRHLIGTSAGSPDEEGAGDEGRTDGHGTA